MKFTHFSLVLYFLFLGLSPSHSVFGCEEDCTVNGVADCVDANCKGCEDNFICVDCCDYQGNQTLCEESGCPFVNGKCQNSANHDCSVPEVPTKNRTWIYLGFMVLAGGITAGLRMRKPKPV